MNAGDTTDCSKHQCTPLKHKSKAPRSEYNEDVHTMSASPVTPPQTKLSKSQSDSPCPSSIAHAYYLDLCSQDLPEVIWDYSPRHKKDKNSGEKLLVIDDLLQYMHKKPEVPPVDSQSIKNLQLLEKWMEVKNVSPISPHVGAKVIKKRISKKRTSRLLREIQAMLNNADPDECSSNATSSSSVCQKQIEHCVIENNNPLTCDDDIWGSETDNDDYILVKATQEAESYLVNFQNNSGKLVDDTCAFKTCKPETLESTEFFKKLNSIPPSSTVCAPNLSFEKLPFTVQNNIPTACTSTITDQIMKSENLSLENAWDNEFDDVLEPETFSQIPDDILMGKIDESATSLKTSAKDSKSSNVKNKTDTLYPKVKSYHKQYYGDNEMISNTSLGDNTELLVNNTELSEEADSDDPFNDGLNEEDFLAWADQTESLFSVKCTPEEIEQKREIAMNKLRQKKR